MSQIPNRPSGASIGMRSLEEAISEVERELQVRKRCYGRWVDDGKLSVVDARDRLDRLAAARDYLRRMSESQEADAIVNPEQAEAVITAQFGS